MREIDKKGNIPMESTTLVAPDISCEHCQHAIEGAVGKMEGVRDVKVDIPTKTVLVNYNPEIVNVAKIEEVLDDIGYTVTK
jgi:copper chaperone